MNDRLQSTLRQLRLSGLAQSLDVRLQEAASHQLSHIKQRAEQKAREHSASHDNIHKEY